MHSRDKEMYKINHERTRSATEKIGLAWFIACTLHMALYETFLLPIGALATGGIVCVILSLVEKEND